MKLTRIRIHNFRYKEGSCRRCIAQKALDNRKNTAEQQKQLRDALCDALAISSGDL